MLNGIDESTTLCVLADVSRHFPAERVTEALEKAIVRVGKPACLRMDNGPEFRAKVFKQWARGRGIRLTYSRPGTPQTTRVSKASTAMYAASCSTCTGSPLWRTAGKKNYRWKHQYNYEIPQQALDRKTPAERFAQAVV